MRASPFDRVLSAIAAVAAPIVIVAVAILLFFNPFWVRYEQDRSGVQELTGYSAVQVDQATGAILHDLVFGPYAFDATVGGQPVLDPKERSHMADVANVFHGLGALALVATAALLVTALVGWRRRWFWEGLVAGAGALAAGVVVVGLAFALFFDQAFTLLHEIFFAAGTWQFNGGTEKLVQLFPDQFWSDTSIGIALAVLLMAVVALLLALRRLRDGPQPVVEVAT